MPYSNNHFISRSYKPVLKYTQSINDLIFESDILSFNIQQQTQSNWCWAATSASVSLFYCMFSPWTQCKIAKEAMNDNGCCNDEVPTECNQPWYLNLALDITQNLTSHQSGTITWDKIKEELNKGLVIGARIGWNGGGGHFMVIYGVTKRFNTQFVHIDDPVYGKSSMSYDQFATNYKGSGTWTNTYFTKAKNYLIMWYKDPIYDPRLLNPILEVRPLLSLHGIEIEKNAIPDLNLGYIHYNYIIGLNQIKENFIMPSSPASLSVIETDKTKPLGMYEFGLNEAKPELLQLSSNKDSFNDLNGTLERLKQNNIKNKHKGELRSVRIPALNLEFLWLHFSNDKDDQFALLKNVGYKDLTVDTIYSTSQFKKAIIKIANRMAKTDNGAMGG